MAGTEDSLLTPRLRLVPIGPDNAADLWLVHNDDAVVPWYDGWRPSRHEADDHARRIAESWRLHGVHKWMAYDRETGEVVGRGGLSRTPIDDDWGQLYAFLPDVAVAQRPANVEHRGDRPTVSLVFGWIVDHGLAPADAPFLRYETIDEPCGAVGWAQHAVGGSSTRQLAASASWSAAACSAEKSLTPCGVPLGRSRPAPAWGVVAGS